MHNSYYETSAKKYANSHSSIPNFYEKELMILRKYINNDAVNLLELGVGHGRDIKPLLTLHLFYFGIDKSTAMIKLAKDFKKDLLPLINLSVQDLNILKFADSFFDVIWAAAVFHHVAPKDLSHSFGELKRIMKKNAVGFLSVRSSVKDYIEIDKEKKLSYYYYSKDTIKSNLTNIGFQVIKILTRTVIYSNAQKVKYLEVFFKKVVF